MPVETLQYDVLIQPDLGGRFEPDFSLADTIVIAEPADRNLPAAEPQESHLERVDRMQERWDLGLGARSNGRILSYNPVFDRVNIELATTPEQIEAVREKIATENKKNLRERYHTPVSVIRYNLDGYGNAYGENSFEPADLVFERGAWQRIRLGSPEPDRELSTVEGGIKAKQKLADPTTPLHSKMVIISGPGVVKDTVYTDNFVDIYESGSDLVTGKKIITMTRFACRLSYAEYRERIGRLRLDYFNEAIGAVDAWYLSNPIFIDFRIDPRSSHELFREEFEYQKEVMRENDFQEVLQVCLPFILNYIDVLCGETFSPHEIAIAFNAILNKGDAARREIASRGQSIINGFRDFGNRVIETFRNIKEEVLWWGRQAVEEFMVGCGLSGGFSLGGIIEGIKSTVSKVWRGIKSLFAGKDKYGSLEFECPKCGATNRRPHGQLIPNCQHCGKDVRC